MEFSGEFKKTREKFSLGLKEIWKGLEKNKANKKNQIVRCWISQSISIAKKTPIVYAMTILTIATTFLVFAFYFLIARNLNNFLEKSHSKLQISVYLNDNVSQMTKKILYAKISKIDGVKKVDYISKKMALKNFKEIMPENSTALDGLSDEVNPLPSSFEVYLEKEAKIQSVLSGLKKLTKESNVVDEIIYNSGYAQKILNLMGEFKTISFLGLSMVLVISGFIIVNTIKLSMWNQQREIEIMKLVGANAYQLRMPYIINGALQGLFGGGISIFFLYILSLSMKAIFLKSEFLSWIENSVSFIGFSELICILFTGLFIGVLASFITVRKFDEI